MHGEETGLPFFVDRVGVPLPGLSTPLTGSHFEWEWLNPTGFPGNVCLDKDIGRYFLLSTDLTPLRLVNPRVIEQGTGMHPLVRT